MALSDTFKQVKVNSEAVRKQEALKAAEDKLAQERAEYKASLRDENNRDYSVFPPPENGYRPLTSAPPKELSVLKETIVLNTEMFVRILLNRRNTLQSLDSDPYLNDCIGITDIWAEILKFHDPREELYHIEPPGYFNEHNYPVLWLIRPWREHYERSRKRKEWENSKRDLGNQISELRLHILRMTTLGIQKGLNFDQDTAKIVALEWITKGNKVAVAQYGGMDLDEIEKLEAAKRTLEEKPPRSNNINTPIP